MLTPRAGHKACVHLSHFERNGVTRSSALACHKIVAKEAVINWQLLGYKVEVSLRVTLDKTHHMAFDNFMSEARKIVEVIEIQTFLGKVDVRLLLIAKDMDDYQRIYRERILHLPHILEIEPLMHITRVRNSEVLPV